MLTSTILIQIRQSFRALAMPDHELDHLNSLAHSFDPLRRPWAWPCRQKKDAPQQADWVGHCFFLDKLLPVHSPTLPSLILSGASPDLLRNLYIIPSDTSRLEELRRVMQQKVA